MSEPLFYALRELSSLEFGRRIARMLATGDIGSWQRLHSTLSALRMRPYLSDEGALSLEAEPLARFDWHLPPNESHEPLTRDALPSAESTAFQWLLMNALLQASDLRLGIPWAKFHFGWTITISDERIVRPGPEQAEYDLLVKKLFAHPGGLPSELAFLAQASYLHAYVPAEGVRELVAAEDAGGLLARLAQVYASSGEPITQSFGDGIARLHQFLRVAQAEKAAVFMCYYTA
jgi:hypothetical protein